MNARIKDKSSRASDADRRLFRDAVGEVRPLRDQAARLDKPRPAPRPRQTQASERQVMQELLTHEMDPANVETGEEIHWRRTGLQTKSCNVCGAASIASVPNSTCIA